ncbi:MAG TPA: (4Fe-4S)-binding protein [Deltaproteobacteria bacterium]|nr:(4Fe-4S)-binding protein [Deltaproteobacteria bacterium]
MADFSELVIISGKGGTGKTSLVACLASLFKSRVVADCDVDAANLNLILNGNVVEKKDFVGGKKAVIKSDLCTVCGKCLEVCRFGAISQDFVVDRVACEGCGACHVFCPTSAIDFSPRRCGECYTCTTADGQPLVFAELLPGEENSGKLVTMVRTEARKQAETKNIPLIVIDGPPGIGCPVIASVTGTSHAVIVTEPTGSGIHDLKRILQLTAHFGINAGVVVNKSDINTTHTSSVKALCEKEGRAMFFGGIPFEPKVSEAQRKGITILDYAPTSEASTAIRNIYKRIKKNMEES